MKTFNKLTDRPVVGIAVVMSDQEKFGKYCLPTSYVKNVEASGARVAPVFPNRPAQYYREMFSQLNGLLVPGGAGAPLDYQRPVTEMVKIFYDMSVEIHDRQVQPGPVYWPIWGTCLGFEILTTITCGMLDCLARCQCHTGSQHLDLKSDCRESRLIKALPEDLVQALSVEPLLPHLHAYCVTSDDFSKFNLHKFYRIIGTNKDRKNLEYVTAVEAFQYPIYALMSHQEKSIFQWNPKFAFNRSTNSIRLGQEFMNFFVQECCKNENKFPNIESENAVLIGNYSPKFTAPFGFISDECYYFK